jgi:hydrogenase maturation protease
MRRLILLGIGSPFGDDTLGWQLLDVLAEQGLELPGWQVTYAKADRPGPGLLEHLKDTDAAVLLDAMQADDPPGTVRLVEPAQLASHPSLTSSHAMGVAESLALGRQLRMLPPKLHILGIQMGAQPGPDEVAQARAVIGELFSLQR